MDKSTQWVEAQCCLTPTLVVFRHHWEGGRAEHRGWNTAVTSVSSHTASASFFWQHRRSQSLGEILWTKTVPIDSPSRALGPDRRLCSKLEPNYTALRSQSLNSQRRNSCMAQEGMRKKHPDYRNQQFLVWGRRYLQKHLYGPVNQHMLSSQRSIF